ncbi:uncharacterized protein [Nicotiana sylvestris]|uniref:uncharacterized protein n=1 Tax=Nicotiana sylvestris TaxID=4096 RepID=UPI00388C49E4
MQLEAEKELQVFNGANPGTWTLFTDGSSNVKGAGLELTRELGINQIIIKSDSQLIVNQMLGTYMAKEARMQQYLEKVRDLIKQFLTWKVTQIPRDENAEADAQANLASVADAESNENALVIHLFHSVLYLDKNEVNFNNLTWYWRNEIVAFLQYGTVPEIRKKLMHFEKRLLGIA